MGPHGHQRHGRIRRRAPCKHRHHKHGGVLRHRHDLGDVPDRAADSHWQDADGIVDHASSVAGLVAGGLLSAPLAGYIVKIAPVRVLTYAVGILVTCLAGYQAARLFGWI